MTVAGLMMVNKNFNDNTYTNTTWAAVSLIPLLQINTMEREFLVGCNYNLYVSQGVYEDRGRLLRGLVGAWVARQDIEGQWCPQGGERARVRGGGWRGWRRRQEDVEMEYHGPVRLDLGAAHRAGCAGEGCAMRTGCLGPRTGAGGVGAGGERWGGMWGAIAVQGRCLAPPLPRPLLGAGAGGGGVHFFPPHSQQAGR
ncbi:hypothetical protein B0H14DRAFT_3633827 [Mycena olivaceomarginata]|nr:hypothetical protein B0H14DRAFT_3633827 [Mycena olivaceomarginata]